jgi:hypothetical protein
MSALPTQPVNPASADRFDRSVAAVSTATLNPVAAVASLACDVLGLDSGTNLRRSMLNWAKIFAPHALPVRFTRPEPTAPEASERS